MKKIIQILSVLIFSAAVIHSQVQQEWVRTFYASGSHGQFINTDNSGNVYVVGSMTGMDAPILTFMQAFTPSGTQLWANDIDTPCSPIGVFLDSMYNQYIAGYYQGGWGPANFSVYKFSTTGARVWSHIEPMTFNDRMKAMTGDRAGNTFIVKFKDSLRSIQKYNSSGVMQFSVSITDTIDPQSIALDQQGSIIVTGFTNAGTIYSCATIKYSSAGAKVWKKIFVPEGIGLLAYPGIKISTANDGSIYLLCTSRENQNISHYTLVKYSTQGTEQWVRYYNLNDQSCITAAMCLENNADNTQNIAITGTKGTVKYNSNGTLVWVDTTTNFNAIKNDNSGNYYLTGTNNSYPSDFRTIKLSSSGAKLWDITYNGTYNYNDAAYSLALDNSGNVYVTGYSNSIPIMGSTFATTIKYSQLPIDTAASNFLPLSIGNVWVYKHYTNTPPNSNFEYRGKVKYQITRDTLMPNGKRYYDKTYLGLTRINPGSLSVFVWASGSETKKDSLKAKLLDTVVTCYHVFDTTGKTIFGETRRNKFVKTFCLITNNQFFWNLTYGLGYWTYSNITDGTVEGFTDTLAGAVINGIVYGDTTMAAVKKISSIVPDEYKISQNYPNPFNPVTKIKFDIPHSKRARGITKLIIFDILGREITNLVNEQLSPGTYEVEWDGSNYPSGVYFYKLSTSDYSETRKMVLVK